MHRNAPVYPHGCHPSAAKPIEAYDKAEAKIKAYEQAAACAPLCPHHRRAQAYDEKGTQGENAPSSQ